MSNTKKAIAIEVLSSGMSIEKASEVAHVSRACVYKWLRDDGFRNDLYEKRREYFYRLSKRLTVITWKALEVIETCLSSRNENIRLRSAGIALQNLSHIVEITEFEGRLQALEQTIGEKNESTRTDLIRENNRY